MKSATKRIIEAISASRSLGDLEAKYWPIPSDKDYVFVSYSHKDYKEVFADLWLLSEQRIPFWYDHSIQAGDDWSNNAEEHLSSYYCKGVVFYLSKNSLSSKSVIEELRFAHKRGKSFFSINFPDRKGEVVCGQKTFESLSLVDEEAKALIDASFNERKLFLALTDSTKKKAEAIEMAMKKDPIYVYEASKAKKDPLDQKLLLISSLSVKVSENQEASLLLINDVNVIKPDRIPDIVALGSRECPVTKIENCAFANCRKMEQITLPQYLKVIKPNAFYNCWALESICVPDSVESIGSSAFSGCRSLTEVVLPSSLLYLKSWAFAGCESLRRIHIPKSLVELGAHCFAGCHDLTVYYEGSAIPKSWDSSFIDLSNGNQIVSNVR